LISRRTKNRTKLILKIDSRAESSDVANAILDGTDCTMLSGETAKGKFPVCCIKAMSDIAREAEACIWSERVFEVRAPTSFSDRQNVDIPILDMKI
jgi:pyruvate kinase